MACAERSELVVLSHDLLHFLDGRGVAQVPRAVADVPRPVREGGRGRGGTRECDTTGQARRRIQKGSPIHVISQAVAAGKSGYSGTRRSCFAVQSAATIVQRRKR